MSSLDGRSGVLIVLAVTIGICAIALVTWPALMQVDLATTNPLRSIWLYGIGGMLAAVFGLYAALVSFVPFCRGDRWPWRAVAVCAGSWFVLDAFVALKAGPMSSVAVSLVIWAALLLPLLANWAIQKPQ